MGDWACVQEGAFDTGPESYRPAVPMENMPLYVRVWLLRVVGTGAVRVSGHLEVTAM